MAGDAPAIYLASASPRRSELLRQIDGARLRHLVVAHISEKNNSRALAERALRSVLDTLDRVIFAEQSGGFDWLDLGGA